MNPAESQITGLLRAWSGGDPAALEHLTPLVYEELRRMARRYMRDRASGNTLQPTALVNEVYLRLAGVGELSWQNRAHFFAVSANIMRRILVDSARAIHGEARRRHRQGRVARIPRRNPRPGQRIGGAGRCLGCAGENG